MKSFEEFTAEVTGMILDGQKKLSKNADWSPAVFLSDGQGHNFVVGIDPGFYQSEFMKDLLSDFIIPKVIQDHNAEYAAILNSGWMAIHQNSGVGPEALSALLPANLDPDRKETVILVAMSKAGQEKSILWLIDRNGDHPQLKPCKEFEEIIENGDEIQAGGRFAEGIRAAFQGRLP